MIIEPIAHVENDYKEKFGIPRQSGMVKEVISKIVFEPEYKDPNVVRGIEGYSHLWLIWQFSQNTEMGWTPTVRPPRLGGNIRMGVFATRSPFRPNSLGLSCVELDRVEINEEGPILYVKGADLLDGTPIFDIKPYIPYADSHEGARSGFAGEVLGHHMEIEVSEDVLNRIPGEKRKAVLEILSLDPRPGYQSDPERIYGMNYGDWNIRFCARDRKMIILDIKELNEEKG